MGCLQARTAPIAPWRGRSARPGAILAGRFRLELNPVAHERRERGHGGAPSSRRLVPFPAREYVLDDTNRAGTLPYVSAGSAGGLVERPWRAVTAAP